LGEVKGEAMKLEKRVYDVELRAESDDAGPRKIVGHAAVFDKPSLDLGGFRELIAPGAFANAIKEGDDVRALWNHDANLVLGRTTSGTLKLSEDDTGLRMDINLEGAPDQVRDLAKSIVRGDVSQASFAFNLRSAEGDSWHDDEDGQTWRTLRDLRLSDVSPVTYPAYPDTAVATRSLEAYLKSKDVEECDEAEYLERAVASAHNLR